MTATRTAVTWCSSAVRSPPSPAVCWSRDWGGKSLYHVSPWCDTIDCGWRQLDCMRRTIQHCLSSAICHPSFLFSHGHHLKGWPWSTDGHFLLFLFFSPYLMEAKTTFMMEGRSLLKGKCVVQNDLHQLQRGKGEG